MANLAPLFVFLRKAAIDVNSLPIILNLFTRPSDLPSNDASFRLVVSNFRRSQMHIKSKLFYGASSAITLALLAACSNGNDFVVPFEEPVAETPPPEAVNTQGDCPTVGNIEPTEIAAGECSIGGVLDQNATLTADMTWFLEDRLQVGNDQFNSTLSIEAGTQIRGSGTDHILVWPGSAIQANGTSASPVQMLSDDEDVSGSAEWGGLFLRGFNGLPTLTGTQGENRLDYVVVAEAGALVEVTIDGNSVTYQDNIVLNGVDSSTTLTFVQSHFSARDGFHILNGDPRMSWLLSTAATRDGVWYRDFSGLIKDLMVIHNSDTGRSGIYASETVEGNSNPRIVNATLVGRDGASVSAASDEAANEFGILFADNTDQIRMANVLIANFRNGCFEADDGADLTDIDTTIPGPTYLDGVHCANEAGANGQFGIVRNDATGFPAGTVASNGSNGDGFVYYNGAAAPITFTGEFADRTENFTSSWYLFSLGAFANGLLGSDAQILNGFLDGDTNNDGVLNADDNGSPFIIADNAFNSDVAEDTGGYDLTHVGAVRSGNPDLASQFDGWTVATGADDGFVVQQTQE